MEGRENILPHLASSGSLDGMVASVGSTTCRTDISVDVKVIVSWRTDLDGPL